MSCKIVDVIGFMLGLIILIASSMGIARSISAFESVAYSHAKVGMASKCSEEENCIGVFFAQKLLDGYPYLKSNLSVMLKIFIVISVLSFFWLGIILLRWKSGPLTP